MKKFSLILVLFSTLTSIIMTDCKKDPVPPTVNTSPITEVTVSSAKTGGDVVDDGGAGITDKGVSYGTTPEPTISGSTVSAGQGSGEFLVDLNGLNEATQYYVRAYATNSAGTSYGDQETFTTTAITVAVLATKTITEISYTTAISGGEISNNGGGEITAKGVCWSTSENPTVENSKTTDGAGSESFNSNLTGLTAGTTYYVRAYATNVKGTTYGNQQTFTTTEVGLATVETKTVTGITTVAAVSGGNISNNGGGEISAKGVCWSTTENPTVENSKTTDGAGSDSFNSNLTGLTEGTTYYVRAYATNSKGTAYGNQQSFTTSGIGLATLETKAVTGITTVAAVSGGNISSDGGALITAKGIAWSTTENPTIEGSHTTDGTGMDPFNSNLTGLMPGTTYYVRAYSTNVKGTAYGNQVSFTTAPGVATVTTRDATEITFTTAVSGGDIVSNGGSDITAKGICWSTSENPTTQNNVTNNGAGNEGFASNITGLSTGVTYYVRAYATNSAGTAYGNQVTFKAAAIGVATLTTKPVSEITFTTAKSGGEISSDGGAAITAKGIVWGTAENPTIENSRTSVGSGNEAFDSNLTGLSDGTTYYVRAYATNSIGTGYGNQVSFTTTAASLPTLTTRAITELRPFSAKSGGEISANGGAPITAKGIVWATTENPTLEGSHTTNGEGMAAFESNMTELTDSTVYYVRAYATNKVGTAYGNQLTFTTPPSGVPVLTTTAVTALTSTTAASGGTISDDGGSSVTRRGIVWGTTPNPTIAGNRTTNGSGTGVFTSNMTGLTNGTVYYVRAYATNSDGTAYGNEITFLTPVTDIEGNVYRTVKIGEQTWMAQNLKTTRFNNNTPIPNVTSGTLWVGLDTLHTPAYSWYQNAVANKDTHGGLYNWFAVSTGNLCPTGWHVPTEAEFQALERQIGVPLDSLDFWGWRGVGKGSNLKNNTGWTGGNGDNTTGFSATPDGYRAWVDGAFYGINQIVYYWLASDDAVNHKPEQGWYRRLDGTDTRIYKATTHKGGGKSIRCLKNM